MTTFLDHQPPESRVQVMDLLGGEAVEMAMLLSLDFADGYFVFATGAGMQSAGNTFTAGIAISWKAPPSDALTPFLQVSDTGAKRWRDVPVGDDLTTITINSLSEGRAYDVRLAFQTPSGIIGDHVMVDNIIAAAVTDPPLPPTELFVFDQGNSTALIEFTASQSAALWRSEILRDNEIVVTLYNNPGSKVSFVDNCGAGDFTWTVRSVNVSNIRSTTDAGPIRLTI